MVAPSVSSPQRSEVLAEALSLTGWSARDLTRAVNTRLTAMGQPGLELTAAYGWLRGSVPRSRAARDLAAAVLSEATGRQYTPGQLWECADPAPGLHAAEGLAGPLSLEEVLQAAAALASGPAGPALVRPAGDGQLAAAAWDAACQPPAPQAPGRGREYVSPEFADMLEEQLAALRRLDDRAGGGPLSQRQARAALRESVALIHSGRYAAATGIRLLRHAGGASQLLGWLSFDARLDPAAHRYLLLAIRIARAAGDDGTAANALGMLAYQHAASRDPGAALRFAHAAVDHAARCPPLVRARAWGRMATACASAGDMPGFRRAAGQCRHLIGQRRPDDPPSLYYLTPQQADAECGQALVDLAQHARGRQPALLAEAAALLSPIAGQGAGAGYRRSALLHGIHLIRAGILARDAEATAHWMTAAAGHLPHVQSARCRALLHAARARASRQLAAAGHADALDAASEALSRA